MSSVQLVALWPGSRVMFNTTGMEELSLMLMFMRSWVRIPAPVTGCIFFNIFVKLYCLLEKTKIREK